MAKFPKPANAEPQPFLPENVAQRLWHYLVNPVLCLAAPDDIAFYRRLRIVVSATIVLALGALAAGFFYSPSKMVNSSGLLFDVAGALRLFLLEEIRSALKPFQDEKAYPHGPPSVAMRELIMPEAGPYTTDAPHMWSFYFKNRGILFLAFGFLLQLVAAWL